MRIICLVPCSSFNLPLKAKRSLHQSSSLRGESNEHSISKQKAILKQETCPGLSNHRLGIQFCHLHKLTKNKEFLLKAGIWEDDATRELKMEQEEAFQKRAEENVQQMLKDGNVELFSFLKEPSTVTFAIQDSQPMLALENSASTPDLQDAADETDTETDSEDEKDVKEPPPCPSI